MTHCSDPSSEWRHLFQLLDMLVGDGSQLCPSPGMAIICRNQPCPRLSLIPGVSLCLVILSGGLGFKVGQLWIATVTPWDQLQPLMHLHWGPTSPFPGTLPFYSVKESSQNCSQNYSLYKLLHANLRPCVTISQRAWTLSILKLIMSFLCLKSLAYKTYKGFHRLAPISLSLLNFFCHHWLCPSDSFINLYPPIPHCSLLCMWTSLCQR